MNWVVFIAFDDGVQWVFRSPRYDTLMFAGETAAKILISEASTLKYLETHCSVPVPKVYSYSGNHKNDIGVPYILQSKAPGRPLSDYRWTETSIQPPGFTHPSQLPLSDEDRQKIMNQLGAIMSRLSNVHFSKIGSLFEDDDGGFSVRECLSPVLTWQSRDSLETELDRGPFSQEDCYLTSLISAFVSHAEELPLSPCLFFSPLPKPADYLTWDSYKAAVDRRSDFIVIGDKLEGSKNRLDYSIAGQILEEMVPLLLSQSTEFTISHPDLHTGNIFVDEELNVTSIIDWASSTTGPVTELLATPGLAGPSRPPSSSLVASFRAGFSEESRNVEQDMWDMSEIIWSFSRLVRLLSGQDLVLFQRLYELAHKSEMETLSDSIDYGRLFHERAMLPRNKLLLSRLSEDDLPDVEVKGREKEILSGAKLERLAVARKLTIMSEMNSGFVGDKRLWQWLDKALEENERAVYLYDGPMR
ncbi:Altered inheritance of mitochondria protein-like protein [Fusarium austroafricanum]|uniref:Altered inheritance of mitochondria protein-like protein n=1 Tax=Fusarium austroafricanum TaxID=2364996 RepID=A0A8H4NL87_9HYPO|nr:Altered inheritance of mitochondria protein-like protein [Fusarium austroafricanum]